MIAVLTMYIEFPFFLVEEDDKSGFDDGRSLVSVRDGGKVVDGMRCENCMIETEVMVVQGC